MGIIEIASQAWRRAPSQPTPLAAEWSRIGAVWYPNGPAIPGQGNSRDTQSTLSGGVLGRAVRSANNGSFNGYGPTWVDTQPTITSVAGWSVLCVYRHVSNGFSQGGLVRTSSQHGLGINGGVPIIYYGSTVRHTSAIAAPTDRASVIIARMRQSGTDEIYVDGALGVSGANGGFNYTGTLTRMGSGFGQGHNIGDYYLALSFPWYLSTAEIQALTENPFRVFRPFPPRLYFLASGGGGDLTVPVDNGALTLAGQSIALPRVVPVSNGAVALAGQTITLPRALAVTSGSVSLTGQTIGVPISMGVTAGALGLAGQGITLANSGDTSLTLPVTAGALTIAGQSIGLPRSLAVTHGSLGLTGSSVTLAVGGALTVPVTAGTLTVTGQPIGLTLSEAARPERITWSLKRRAVGFALARRTVACRLTRRTLTLAAS